MKPTLVILAMVAVVLVLAERGEGLKCYACSSASTPDCAEGGKLKSDWTVPCPSALGLTNVCFKNVLGSLTTRGCMPGPVGDKCEGDNCHAKCDTELCNGQVKGAPSLWLGLLSMALALLFIGKY